MLSNFARAIRHGMQNTTLWIIKWSMKILPRWLVHAFIDFLFSIAFLFLHRIKKICARNLYAVYGDSKNRQEYEAMIKRCIKSIGHSAMDLLYFVRRPKELSKVTAIHNEDSLKQALGLGHGVIAVSAHLGNFPLMFVSLVQKGYKVNVIIRPMRDSTFSDLVHDLCAIWNINMIQTSPKKRFIKECFSVLRRNELLFILSDEFVPKEEGILVDFFGSKVSRTTGPMLFHKRIGSPVVPIFIAQDEEQGFHVFIEKELKIENAFSENENNIKNISSLTRVIERFILKFPTQWGGWLNKRWLSNHSPELSKERELAS